MDSIINIARLWQPLKPNPLPVNLREKRLYLVSEQVSAEDFIFGPIFAVGVSGYVHIAKDKESHISLLDGKCPGVLAIKVCPKRRLRNFHCVRDEYRAQMCIGHAGSHPMIARPYAGWQDENFVFFVSEFVNGGELWQLMEEYPNEFKLPKFSRFYLTELVSVIDWLHARGIIHRDIKPENILIAKDGHIKLTDFGKAKHVCKGEKMELETILGTLEYAAPELGQIYLEVRSLEGDLSRYVTKGYPLTGIDWWSVGVVAYEMAVGQRLFSFPYRDEVAAATTLVEMPVHLPSNFKTLVPHTLYRHLIESLLCKDPFRRLSAPQNMSIKDHPFFLPIDWDLVPAKHLVPPILPSAGLKDTDTSRFENDDVEYQGLKDGEVFGQKVNVQMYGDNEDGAGEDYDDVFEDD